MIIVTGAAGFIGSCVVARLNELGREDLILVDHLNDDDKKRNLEDKIYLEYYEKDAFLNIVKQNKLPDGIEAVIHMGACSSTTLQDEKYFKENNLEYTITLAQWCLAHQVRFIYASSAATYGDGSCGYKDDIETIRQCKPLNLYGESKQKFDEWVLEHNVLDKVVGLKFFNVFGPNEYHKGDMCSVVAKSYHNVVEKGTIRLFKSFDPKYKDGEQMRDFIYVKDAVEVILFFLKNNDINGIFNVGTGKARTWNDLAQALFAAVDIKPDIQYMDMPETLKARYQNFTQADMTQLKEAGYTKPFYSLEDAVKDYTLYLKDNLIW